MTWVPMLEGLPRAGSDTHHYKQNIQKKEDLPKQWVLTGKKSKDVRRKENTILS